MAIGALALFFSVFLGCAVGPGLLGPLYIGPDNLPTGQTALRHQYTGFSVRPLRTPGWYVRVKEQDRRYAIFRKELPGKTHSFVVSVGLFALQNQAETIEQFGNRLRKERAGDTSRSQVVDSEQRVDTSWGKQCVSYRVRLIDRAAPNLPGIPLELIEQGFACLHPTIKDAVVNTYHSERGLPSELDRNLQTEGEAFLKGVQIESAPGVPAP